MSSKLVAFQDFEIHLVGLKLKTAAFGEQSTIVVEATHFHPQKLQKADEFVDITYIGNIVDAHSILGEQYRTKHLQRFVLGALGEYLALEFVSADYFE